MLPSQSHHQKFLLLCGSIYIIIKNFLCHCTLLWPGLLFKSENLSHFLGVSINKLWVGLEIWILELLRDIIYFRILVVLFFAKMMRLHLIYLYHQAVVGFFESHLWYHLHTMIYFLAVVILLLTCLNQHIHHPELLSLSVSSFKKTYLWWALWMGRPPSFLLLVVITRPRT